MLVTSQCITHGRLVLNPHLKKLAALLQHEVLEATKAEEMKLQILDEGLDSNREGENYFIS
jgi:hypothetical protein